MLYNETTVKQELKDAIEKMRGAICNSKVWPINENNSIRLAIVLGWTEDTNSKPNPKAYIIDGYKLCIKLAYQPITTSMYADYDLDWMYPQTPLEFEVTDSIGDNEVEKLFEESKIYS